MFLTDAELIKNQQIAKNTFCFSLKNEKIAKKIKPGQFVNILVEGFSLRRPFSVCETKNDIFKIVFKVKGAGTKKMSSQKPGEILNILAPLGNGFKPIEKKDCFLLIGGGVGSAPLLELCKKINKKSTKVLLGFNKEEEIILKNQFEKYSTLTICTKEKSHFKTGFVTDFVLDYVKNFKINRIAACGPNIMLEKIISIAQKNNIFCEASFEERMACGIGACLACQKIIEKNGEKFVFHVCKDGPVFSF